MGFSFHKLTLKNKLLLATLPIACLVFSVYTVMLYTIIKEDSKTSAIREANNMALVEGMKIRKPINKAFNVVRTLATILSNTDLVGLEAKRDYVDKVTKQIAQSNSEYVSVWVLMEPNALDGRDAAFANKPGKDPSGRYNGGWRRDKGILEYDVAFDYNTPGENDYYTIPKNTKKEAIIEPYYYSYTGNSNDKILMTTITVPIIKNGIVIGVAGIDLALKKIQEQVASLKPFETGFAYLLSNQGFYAGHKDATLLGKKFQNVEKGEVKESILTGINSGKDFHLTSANQTGDGVDFRYFQPITVGSETNWYLVVSVPESVVYAKLYSMMQNMGIVAIIASIIFGAVVLFSAIQISKPILKLSKSAANIAEGDLSEEINVELNTKDEVAIMANSLAGISINVRNVLSEAKIIYQNAELGKLDYRGDSDKFQGSYKELIVGFNVTLDSIIKPLNVAAEYIDRIAKGDLPKPISEEYKGDFNEIKNNINTCIDSINSLVFTTRDLASKAIEGNISARADESLHLGDYRKIISGVNSALDRLVGLIDGMPIPVQIVNKSQDIIYLNKAAKNIELTAYNDNHKI